MIPLHQFDTVGTSKSFRMSDRIENMFNSIKRYDSTIKSDSEILTTGIEMQFEMQSQTHNPYYREKISKYLKSNKLITLFNDICDIMETLSFSDGYFLEDEVRRFMTVIEADRFFEAYNDDEFGEINYQQYQKAYQVLCNRGVYVEKDFQLLADTLQEYYENKE